MTIIHSKMAPRPSQGLEPQGHVILSLRSLEAKDVSLGTLNCTFNQQYQNHWM